MISNMLGLFLNTLTADDKYALCNRNNLLQPIQVKLSKNQKIYCPFFAVYLQSASNFKKKITLIGYVFPKLEIAKFVVS